MQFIHTVMKYVILQIKLSKRQAEIWHHTGHISERDGCLSVHASGQEELLLTDSVTCLPSNMPHSLQRSFTTQRYSVSLTCNLSVDLIQFVRNVPLLVMSFKNKNQQNVLNL